jgi:hypothetical protein
VCEQRTHGSVGAGAGNRPGYPMAGSCPDTRAPPGMGSGRKPADFLDIDAGRFGRGRGERHGLDGQVAALDELFVVLLQQQRAAEADD